MKFNSVIDILRIYPQRNNAWMPLDTCFVAEASELGLGRGIVYVVDLKDPWNRRLGDCRSVKVETFTKDNETTHWDVWVTVEGERVRCKIIND